LALTLFPQAKAIAIVNLDEFLGLQVVHGFDFFCELSDYWFPEGKAVLF